MGRCVSTFGVLVLEFASSSSTSECCGLCRFTATTVAATMWLAHAAGISTFVTGELSLVHISVSN